MMTHSSVTLPGYQLAEQIYNGSRTLVYRGTCNAKGKPVIIKFLRNEYPTFSELLQFRNQYAIAKNLNLPGITRPISLEPWKNGYALVMEDCGSISLQQYAQNQPLGVEDTLTIGIQLTEILHGLYQNRVIHKDIKPANILIHPVTKQVKLIDFSISSLLPKETQEIQNPNVLEGTLPYISPEQTGRMNRGIDYRTDFYSLGVTFYELLAGELPFKSDDPMELVHCHIAKIPPGLGNREQGTGNREEVPQEISDIILKLMAKNVEERYQSALGLKYDLEKCLKEWQETQTIERFELGKRDVRDRFILPEKLYGREAEVAQLLAAFERVSQGQSSLNTYHSSEREIDLTLPPSPFPLTRTEGSSPSPLGRLATSEETSEAFRPHPVTPSPCHQKTPPARSELILVAGYSGVGKTAVVNEVHKPIVRQRGYFIKGKFDQFNRNIPFSAFVQAFRDLMGQLLSERDAQLQQWKSKILNALGENGQVIIEVIPELEEIIGKQPPVPELSGSAAQNRFNLLFSNFIKVFTTKDHPLVIFLDDLQWADSASLNLLKLLMNESETGYLLVLGAYRDNEVFPAHPLMLTLDDIQKQGANINTLALAPLGEGDINHLVADALRCSTDIAMPLSQLVYQKTQGNPFFTTQFLKGLHEDGWIAFAPDAGYWQCDLVRVRQLALTDDVVDFMVSRLQKLPEATQAALKLAACIGNWFDLATLAVVCESTQEEVAADLWRGLQEGFVIPQSETYKFFQGKEIQKQGAEAVSVRYRFLHDRVQQAAYSLIPNEQKQSTHLAIGRSLLQNIPEAQQQERIFEVVSQLNEGIPLITQQAERDALAQLNLISCCKAKSATAYQAGRKYASTGLLLLGEKAWQRQYELTLEFHDLAAELSSLCGDFEAMEQWVETVIARANSLLEKVSVYRINIQSHVFQNRATEAITIARQFLKQLGVSFPETPTQEDLQQLVTEIGNRIGDREIEDLIHLPRMAENEKIAAVQIVSSIIPAAKLSGSPLFPLLVAWAVKLSIQYGNTPASALAYSFYGVIVCHRLQDVNAGVKFGQLALQVVSKLDAKAVKAKVFSVVTTFVLHRKYHIRETLPLLQEGYTTGLEVGSLEFLGYSAQGFCRHAFWCAQPLTRLEQETRTYCHALVQLNQVTTANWCRIYWQTILNLLRATERPSLLSGEALQEAEFLPSLISAHNFLGLYYFYTHKLMLAYLFEEFDLARNYAVEVRPYSKAGRGTIVEPAFYCYASLAILAQLSSQPEVRAEQLQQVEQNQAQLQQYWADYAPMNYQHKVDLVAAEKYRVLGQNYEARDRYDRAISGAKANGYTQEEALANELAAKFYLNWEKEKVASNYMQEAYYCYTRWGAKAKVEDLERRYPQLLSPILNAERSSLNPKTTIANLTTATISRASLGSRSFLDLETALKVSQAISEEIDLKKLLRVLMQATLENAGAQKGSLVLKQDGEWCIEAQGINDPTQGLNINALQSIPIEASREIPCSLINYVARTQKTAILDDATASTQFASDPYLIEFQPKSLLCTPILKQGRALGILYLENNLISGVFTRDRAEVLNFLCTQAAISIENAQLYERLKTHSHTLEAQVDARTQSLDRFSNHLKQIHRLTTTEYQNLDDLCEDYLQTGRDIFGMTSGIVSQIEGEFLCIRAAVSDLDVLIPDRAFKLADTYYEAVVREEKTITCHHAGATEAMRCCPMYEKLQIESYIGTPIWVKGKMYGLLNFCSTQIKEREFDDREIEIIELMAQSLGKFIAQHQAETELRDRAAQLRQQNAILTDLAKNPALIRGDLPLSLQAITAATAQTLATERVSVWFYSPEKTHLDCQDLFELTPNQHSQGIQLTAEDYPAYFKALSAEKAVVANNARTDPKTCEFTPNYLTPLGIFSLLDVPIRSRGQVLGVLCIESVGEQRDWTIEDENFARAISDLITAALEARDRAQAQTTLKRRNALLQAQQEASIDGILVVNEHHQVVSFNQRFCELWEIPRELTTPDSEKERLNYVLSQLTHPEEFLAKIEHLYNHPTETSRDEIRFKDGRILDRYSGPIQSKIGEYYGRIWYFRDITIQKQQEESLRFLVEGTASQTGNEFFNSCVRSLARSLQVRYVFIAEYQQTDNSVKANTLAFWSGEDWGDNFEYDLTGTPCQNIYQCRSLHRYPQNVQKLFPDDTDLVTLEAESYAGVPIFDGQGNLLGLIAILDTQPMNRNLDIQTSILELFAARVGAEIKRMQAEEKLLKQEQFLRSIYDGAEQALFVIDVTPEGTFRYAGFNPVAERYGKITRSEIEGATPEEVFGVEIGEQMRQRYQQCLQSQKAIFYEEAIFVDGQKCWTFTSLSPLKDEKGQICRIIGTANDITDRKKAEEVFKKQAQWSEFRAKIDSILTRENSLHSMLQQCTEVIVKRFDAAFARIWLLNPAEKVLELKASAGLYTHLDGAHSSIPMGKFKIGLIAEEGKPHLTNAVQHDPRVGDKEWAKREGMVSFAGYPLIVEGQVLGVFGMFARHSLSETVLDELAFVAGELSLGIRRKQSEEALQQSEIQLRQKAKDLEQTLAQLQRTQSHLIQSEKMSSLGQLVAGVAHEINNPVSFIYGNINPATQYTEDLLYLLQSYQQEYPHPSSELVDLMEEIDLDFMRKDLPKLLNSMKFGAERIREIVKSLRTFSRLDEAEVKDIDLHDNIDSTLMILQNRLKATSDRVEIQITKEYGTLPRVECYAGQLNQVFMNIISNAIDALEESLIRQQGSNNPATISIRTKVLDNQWVSIRIADNGLGMSEAVQQQIFDPFFTTKPIGKGTGLGMAISYQIVVDRHQGELTCQSVPGEGTMFAIAIPIKQKVD